MQRSTVKYCGKLLERGKSNNMSKRVKTMMGKSTETPDLGLLEFPASRLIVGEACIGQN